MNKESLSQIFPSSEIEVIETNYNLDSKKDTVFDVYVINKGDNDYTVIHVQKEDFENWFTGEFGIDGTREQFFEKYYDREDVFQDDMLTFLLDTKRDREAMSYSDNWTSIFNSIQTICKPEIAA